MIRKYFIFTVIVLFALLGGLDTDSNIFTSISVASLLLLCIAVFKPSLALPFLANATKKVSIIGLLATLFIGMFFSPKVETEKTQKTVENEAIYATLAPSSTPTSFPTMTPIITLTSIPSPIPASPTPTVIYTPPTQTAEPTSPPAIQNTGGGYACNCAKTCPSMSCEEAYFQLQQCGCSTRDGDNDGVPCESVCN